MATIFPTTVPTKRLAASITAASLTMQLNNIEGWNGSDLTSADFGTLAYAVLRNSENTLMEIIEFDPSTIASASITITRRGLNFTGDLTTELTARKLTWIRNDTLVELGTDVPQLLKHFVTDVGVQSIAGVKTFSESPIVPTPSGNTDAANKAYVDGVVTGGAADANTTTKGLMEEATEAEIEAGTAAGGTAARLAINPSTLKSSDYGAKVYGRYGDYAADAQANDTYVITLAPVPSAYVAGMMIQFKPATLNTGACTINVNSLGATAIKIAGSDPNNGDFQPGHIYCLVYDGTNFELLNPHGHIPTGSLQMWLTGTAPNGWLLADGSAVSRTTYASLFAIISDTYGPGDGSTTFNLPNFKNNVPVGVDTSVKTVLEDCEDAWAEAVDGDVTSTADNADVKVGTNSVKLVVAAGASAGDKLATEAISSTDLSGVTSISLWIKSTVATAAGDLALMLDDSASCASPLETINIPALVADTWHRVRLPLANPGLDTAIISIGLQYVNDIGACTIRLDDVCYGENFELGATGGEKTHTLIIAEMPAHTHSADNQGGPNAGSGTGAGVAANNQTGSTGGGKKHPNMQPYLAVNYIIKT